MHTLFRGRSPLLATAICLAVVTVSSVGAAAASTAHAAQHVAPKSTLVSTFTAPDSILGDMFGKELAVSGDTLVIGAPDRTVGTHTNVGAVFVYTKSKSGSWASKHPAELSFPPTISGPEDEKDNIAAVAISGKTIVVGDSEGAKNGQQIGTAYVYQEPKKGWKTTTKPTATLTPSNGVSDDFFGEAVSISGGTIVVGAPLQDVGTKQAQGVVYVFTEPKNGKWTSTSKAAELTASDGVAMDLLGASVGISQQTIVAGAPNRTVNGKTEVGEAYVWVEPKAGWKNATEGRRIEPAGLGQSAQLGNLGAIAVITGTIAIGAPYFSGNDGQPPAAPGAVYVFNEPKAGWTASKAPLTKAAVLTAKNGIPYDIFGGSVAISKNILAIGAIGHTVGKVPFAGATYVFAKPKAGWKTSTQTLIVTSPHVSKITEFGDGALSGDTLLVGAPYGNKGTGDAQVFNLTGSVFPKPTS